jgi:purine-cytosine permease-like protein
MNSLLLFFVYLVASPLILFYGLILGFFFVNGVTGSDRWILQFWNSCKVWWQILALLIGLLSWVIVGVQIVV